MKVLKVITGLIFLTVVLLSINANSAYVIKDTSDLINAYNNNNLVRFHVVANSNSPEDQYIKRQVRDEVIKYMSRTSPDGLKKQVSKTRLQEIEEFTNNLLTNEGVDYRARVQYGRFYFPKRTYGKLTLPAGDYNALKIILGKGQGANWWCVLFPPLCVQEKNQSASVSGSIKSSKIEFRFKILELLQDNKKKINDIKLTRILINKLELNKFIYREKFIDSQPEGVYN
ncbi:stage II sporulation protein R [Halothermothrix orenii]|uniref:Sporulation stage II protein R n=1 Tax=Halothermothrix orenii (strain H 168 / OCM 544 / DSM 9562) TaxID=373903 RepID=B8CWK4_HALOH|nr:stage II sporulation protein R [Halothermothrix orenii]ACL69673.1 Sporulation stage II protein R [Halothermothrix orenii H 168]